MVGAAILLAGAFVAVLTVGRPRRAVAEPDLAGSPSFEA
jgi:hypothetical protein